jgi:hypothetical protein
MTVVNKGDTQLETLRTISNTTNEDNVIYTENFSELSPSRYRKNNRIINYHERLNELNKKLFRDDKDTKEINTYFYDEMNFHNFNSHRFRSPAETKRDTAKERGHQLMFSSRNILATLKKPNKHSNMKFMSKFLLK